ncbi:MAG: carbohydrate kinase [Actinomycetota bacterium]|nr:carbohydrate kinase [Actinomycetota bacterium]
MLQIPEDTPTSRETERTAVLTVIGESLVDIINDSRIPGSGTRVHPGGSPLNVAIGCARLGVATALVTDYAEDRYGRIIDQHLSANNVTVINGASAATSQATAALDAEGAAKYTFEITWNPRGASLEALSVAEGCRHVHTGSIATVLPPGNEAVYTLVNAARGHASISYDPNCRPAISADVTDARRQAEKFAAVSDIVKASDEDLKWLYPGKTLEQTMEAWLKLGPSIMAITRGAKGPILATRKHVVEIPAERIDVEDTVGAGDSFMAGLIAGLHRMDLLGVQARERLADLPPETLRSLAAYANKAAAITCSRPGADPPWARELGDSTLMQEGMQ